MPKQKSQWIISLKNLIIYIKIPYFVNFLQDISVFPAKFYIFLQSENEQNSTNREPFIIRPPGQKNNLSAKKG